MASLWKDSDFQKNLLAFLVRDRNFLKKCGGMLSQKDFRPNRDETWERWIIATKALDFWRKYQTPIAGMLRAEIIEHCNTNNVDEETQKALFQLVKSLRKTKLVAAEAMEDRVLEYKRDKNTRDAVDRIIELREEGRLGPKELNSICREVMEWSGEARKKTSNITSSKAQAQRTVRRKLTRKDKIPRLFIDEFDKRANGIQRGELGLLMALYKMGKSMALCHLAFAYAIQSLNVLFITTEDSITVVEDRMDAAATGIPIDDLAKLPKKLRRKFRRFIRKLNGRVRIVDATEEGISVDEIDDEWQRARDEGFDADVIIVDYDDEIKPPKTYRDNSRRFEFADIYRALRRLAVRRKVILWTAAQTQRIKENTKIISGDKLAEDISKARKVTLAIGIGQGETHADARYIYVAAHKNGPMRFGFEIMAKPNCGIFYDRDRTARMVWVQRKKKAA